MPNVTFRIISVLPVGYYNSSCIAHLFFKKSLRRPSSLGSQYNAGGPLLRSGTGGKY